MKDSLAKWIRDADTARQLGHFQVLEIPLHLSYLRERSDDYYLALVGELFERIGNRYDDSNDWARLGNAFAQFADRDALATFRNAGIAANEAKLYAASAFYFGGFPASAYVTLKGDFTPENDTQKACYDLLARPLRPTSTTFQLLLGALRRGDFTTIDRIEERIAAEEAEALSIGPDQWIPAKLLTALFQRFKHTNVRAVLPDGMSDFWDPLVSSFLGRTPPNWEFFQSQIQAIEDGLLTSNETCSLLMPTGSGKTALTETLLFHHLKSRPVENAILLVPFRSLASELKNSLVRRLGTMGIAARSIYGGTVAASAEVQRLEDVRALVVTPESLTALMGAAPSFINRVSLVICDEGHLLDDGARGIGLELLLARLKYREARRPRFVFVSAIVPNIEEVNAWLGTENGFVVRSNYRPAIAEFAVLRPSGVGNATSVSLQMHPHEADTTYYSIDGFLSSNDFRWFNQQSNRFRTLNFNTTSAQALGAARKALAMGSVAIYASNKRGPQGAIGLAEALCNQLDFPLSLVEPIDFANKEKITRIADYLRREYGPEWVGTKAIALGFVLHHGDIPQETREVLESAIRDESVGLVICTSTLAEGVNLPIRTLVLYSVVRSQGVGERIRMSSRDIKNWWWLTESFLYCCRNE